MATSKEVLSVLGRLCISRTFRRNFFDSPQAQAESVAGKLQAEDLEQIMALAGHRKLPAGLTRDAFVTRFKAALDQVYVASDCPNPPCPPDPNP
ncbi:MAG TPA: hypothetical protein VF921_15525 [Vicinamibacterales bacterium]